MRFYELRTPDVWGDYGTILIGGMASDEESKDGSLLLSRTGPFIPPISFPCDDPVVTDVFRGELAARFPELKFREVTKEKIVELHWEHWPRDQEAREYPESYEPEDYIFRREHSPTAAEKMGPVWQVVLSEGIQSRMLRSKKHLHWKGLTVILDTWDGSELLYTRPFHFPTPLASQPAKDWLQERVGDWIEFQPVVVIATAADIEEEEEGRGGQCPA